MHLHLTVEIYLTAALRRNVPSAEPDTYFVSQSSLKPLGIQASNLLYDEEIHQCKCTCTSKWL